MTDRIPTELDIAGQMELPFDKPRTVIDIDAKARVKLAVDVSGALGASAPLVEISDAFADELRDHILEAMGVRMEIVDEDVVAHSVSVDVLRISRQSVEPGDEPILTWAAQPSDIPEGTEDGE